MGIKCHNHHTISAINYRHDTHTCPLSNILEHNNITTVACLVQKDSELDGDMELGLILEDRVIRYIIEDVIKNL